VINVVDQKHVLPTIMGLVYTQNVAETLRRLLSGRMCKITSKSWENKAKIITKSAIFYPASGLSSFQSCFQAISIKILAVA
jgi:hypothetical protein